MLIGFSVGNYKSFKETVTLSMVASSITEEEPELDTNNVFEINHKLKLLKTAAIYGANSSGKSNLIAAINFMKWFVLNSSKETQVSEAIDVEAFRLSTETEKEPSFFEIVFLLEGKTFRYGFEVNAREVVSEWLFQADDSEEKMLFERDHDTNLLSSKTFRKDQVWFTEKDNKGATDLYSLVEYKVGKDASFEDDYIIGKYGAIPFIGNFKELIG